jgi:glycosyltransferase involved in cell wall biosynthesis
LAICACNELKVPLVIVGEGSQERHLRSIAGPTIEFRGRVPDEDIADVYAGAKALIFPAIEEDFGMVPVEAMAHGVPVIGHNSGGTAETIINGKTGLLFNDWSPRSLARAIEQFGHRDPFDNGICRRQAVKFSISRFTDSIRNIIREHLIRKEQLVVSNSHHFR